MKEDNPVYNDHRNIQALATEMFKVKKKIAPEIMKEPLSSKWPKWVQMTFVITVCLIKEE